MDSLRWFRIIPEVVLFCAWPMVAFAGSPAETTFTYQGQLKLVGIPINDTCDFEFELWNADVGGASQGAVLPKDDVSVINGLFSVELDFGGDLLAGGARWIEISVGCPIGENLTLLTPRQPLTPVPYSVHTRGVRVDDDGEVHIGSMQQTGSALEVAGFPSTPGRAPLKISTDIGTMLIDSLRIDGDNGLSLNSSSSKDVDFVIGGGKVVIGTFLTGDARLKVVQSEDAFGSGITCESSVNNNQLRLWVDAAGVSRIDSGNASSTKVLSLNIGNWDQPGKVGIATTTPSHLLTIGDEFVTANNDINALRLIGPSGGFGYGAKLSFGDGNLAFIQEDIDDGLEIHTEVSKRLAFTGGKVGVGTKDPATMLHVVGSENNGTTASVKITSGSQHMLLDGNEIDSDSSAGLYLNNNSAHNVILATGGGRVGVGTSNPVADFHVHGAIHVSGTGRDFSVPVGEVMQFGQWSGTSFTERMRVTSGGRLGIATTNPGFTLHVNGTAGKPGGGSWSVPSDRRLKKNIKQIEGSLDRLLSLRGVTFEYKNPEAIHELSGKRIGLIAQEVEQVFPDWVDQDDVGFKRLTVRGFEALTIEALRELRQERDGKLRAKDAQIAELQDQLADIQRRMATMEMLLTGSTEIQIKRMR